MCGSAGVGKAETGQRRPLPVSLDPATGPGVLMDAQGASRRRSYAEEEGVGRRRSHLFHRLLEVEVTSLFQVQPDHGHARDGLHGGERPPATGPLPSCSSCGFSRAPRPAPPRRKSVVVQELKNALMACWEMQSPPHSSSPLPMCSFVFCGAMRGVGRGEGERANCQPRRKGFWEL